MKKQQVSKMTGTELLSEDSDKEYRPSRPPHYCGGAKPQTKSTNKKENSTTACSTSYASMNTKNQDTTKKILNKLDNHLFCLKILRLNLLKRVLKDPTTKY